MHERYSGWVKRVIEALATGVLLLTPIAQAQVPHLINYQGYLVSSGGTPITGTVPITFKLYDAPLGGQLKYTETQSIAVSNGTFNAIIGAVTALPPTLDFKVPYYLSLTVDGDPEMTPRQALLASPYAMRSVSSESLDTTAAVTGSQITGTISVATLPVTQLSGTIATAQIADGAVTAAKLSAKYAGSASAGGPATTAMALAANGSNCPSGQYAAGVDAQGNAEGCTAATTGTVTNVGTGAGLTGGPIASSGTINLAGTQLLPTVACGNNQIPKWNGSAWACADVFLLGGNTFGAGVTSATLGTLDNRMLQLWVNGLPGLRIYPETDSHNIIGGNYANAVNFAMNGQTIGGGGRPTSDCWDTVLQTASGSCANSTGNPYTTVGGGLANRAMGVYATVAGGASAVASGDASAVGGGDRNKASGNRSVVAGGDSNTASGSWSSVGGGQGNAAAGTGATVGGGGLAASNCDDPVTGLQDHTCANVADTPYATIGGGEANAATGGWYSSIGGGYANRADGSNANVSGGALNIAQATSATVGGGELNNADHVMATVGGGYGNWAGGDYSFVGGGSSNGAFGANSAVLGGSNNTVIGDGSTALGSSAHVNSTGSFVYCDSSPGQCNSLVDNEFIAVATGGFNLFSKKDYSVYCKIPAGGGSWNCTSSRDVKTAFEHVDPRSVLEKVARLPMTTWQYITERSGARHLGPMAQDFHAAFGLGDDERSISMVDAQGVALAAIQGLYDLLGEKDREIGRLRAKGVELENLKERLAAIEATLGIH